MTAEREANSLVEGCFLGRPNRFTAEVDLDGRTTSAHLPNTGRMRELLVPGTPALLRPAHAAARRTAFDLVAVWHAGRWVGIDSRATPSAVVHAWERGMLPGFEGYTSVRREVRFGESRLDLLFDGPGGDCYVEAKSVNLVEGGVALFPDAPTTRGVRHLAELARAVHEGHAGVVVFVVQRDDARALTPHPTADPAFAQGLRDAVHSGVRALAVACRFVDGGLEPAGTIPVAYDVGERAS